MPHPEFPLDPDICYLNHAAVSPWPVRTRDAVQAFAQENAQRGSRHYDRWLHTEHLLREQLRELINAETTDEIALLKNTSEALSFVAYGLDWQVEDEIIISSSEFPSNRIVWESLQARFGVHVKAIDLMSCESPEMALANAITPRTRLLSVSSVQYGTGLRLDLETLGAACQDAGILFCIDAIQSVGAEPIDVQAARADFIMADGHKWMLGPEGLALFYCRLDKLERLKLHEFGWHMVDHAGDFDQKGWNPSPSATRFECGSPNLLGTHALHASLSLVLETGIDAVAAGIHHNVDRIVDYLQTHSDRYEIITDLAPDRHVGILTFKPLAEELDPLYRRLQDAGVICAKRGGGIRFSPHFYTPDAVIDRALSYL